MAIDVESSNVLGQRPRMIKVDGDMTRLAIQLPWRAGSDVGKRNRVLVWMVAAWFGTSVLASGVQGVLAARVSGWAWVMIAIAGVILPYWAGVRQMHRGGDQGRITLTQQMLRVEGRRGLEVPLDEITDILPVLRRDRGFLRFHTLHGDVDLCDGLFAHELAWVQRVVQYNVEQRRLALTAEGQDVDRVVRAPQALDALRQR